MDLKETLSIGAVVLTFLGTSWRYGWKQGKLENELNILKKKVNGQVYLTEEAHKEMQQSCRVEIYRDIDDLKLNFKTLEDAINKKEDRRLIERKEDEARWRRMEDSILEITTLLKVSILPHIKQNIDK